MTKKINYLNNKDMLVEIHRSKTSFCEFTDKKYSDFDIILTDKSDCFNVLDIAFVKEDGTEISVSENTIHTARTNRSNRITAQRLAEAQKESPDVKIAKKEIPKVLPDTIDKHDLVFRVITYDHIPLQQGRKKNPKTPADERVKLNFHPFKHYIFNEDCTELVEVGRSHFKNGEFSLAHGCITDKLARMFLLLVHRYSQMPNWRSYTYLDEMKGHALMQLSHMSLQFNEAKSDNPFCYYSCTVENSFTRVLNTEKKMQNIRDDLLMQAGQNPSYTRQLEHEEQSRINRESNDDNFD